MSKTDLIKGAVANMLIIFDAASQHTDMRHEGHKSLDILRTLNITVQRRAEYSTVKVEETLIEVVRSAITNDVEAIDALALHSMYIHKDSEGTYSLCLTNAANTNILKKSHIDIEQIKLIKEVRGNYQNNGTIWYKKSRLRVQCFIPMSLLENED
jgi:hypothetical protein